MRAWDWARTGAVFGRERAERGLAALGRGEAGAIPGGLCFARLWRERPSALPIWRRRAAQPVRFSLLFLLRMPSLLASSLGSRPRRARGFHHFRSYNSIRTLPPPGAAARKKLHSLPSDPAR